MTRRTRCAVAGGLLGLGAAARSVMRKSVFNRRTAPTLYRGVVGITREHDGSCALGGIGTPVDWLVEMNRFPQEACSTGLASAGHLDLELMSPLAAASADFHTSAERRADHGGKPGMSWVIEGNATGCAEFGKACLKPSAWHRLTDGSCRELERRTELLERRRASRNVSPHGFRCRRGVCPTADQHRSAAVG